ADLIRPEHEPAAIAREAEPVQPHDVDVARAQRLAFLEYLARFVDRREQEPAQDLFGRESALLDAHLARRFLDDALYFRIRMRRAVALLVAVPARPGLLPVTAHLDQPVRDRKLAEIRIGGGTAAARGIADVQARQIADREGPHRVAEVHHHLV